MPDRTVYKSRVVELLDEYHSGTDAELREAYDYSLTVLDSEASLKDMVGRIAADGREPAPGEFAHPVDESNLKGPQFEDVIRRGYTHAIQLALRHKPAVPIETLWMTGVCDEFEMHICDGARQVTVLWLIPEDRNWGSERAEISTSWVVTPDGQLNQKSGKPGGGQTSA
jgi:hypothetical protein